MTRTIVDLARGLPDAELKSLVETALRRKSELNRQSRGLLEQVVDDSLEVDGFRKPHSASLARLLPVVVPACTAPPFARLLVTLILAWVDLHKEDQAEAGLIVKGAGLEARTRQDLREPLQEWAQGQLGPLVVELLRRRPGLNQHQAALLICILAGRYADLGHLEPLPEAPQAGPEPGDQLAPLWARTLDEARRLPPSAPEWSNLDGFFSALAGVRAAKAREATGEVEAADLADALLKLQAVPEAVATYFEHTAAVAACGDPEAQWRSKGEAAARISAYAKLLNQAEPLTRPAATLAEQRKRVEALGATERAIREAQASVMALLEPQEQPQPVPAAEPGAAPLLDEPSPSAAAGGSPVDSSEAPLTASAASGARAAGSDGEPEGTPAAREEGPADAPAQQEPGPLASDREGLVAPVAMEPDATEVASDDPEAAGPGTATPEIAGAVAPLPAPDLPPRLRSYVEFASSHWVAPTGQCEEVPWNGEAFAVRLEKAMEGAMTPAHLVELWIFALAAAESGAAPSSAAPVVRALGELLSAPSSPTAGSYPDRSAALRDAGPGADPWRRIELFLEAVRPSRETPLTFERAKDLVEAAGYRDTHLRQTILSLLKVGSLGMDPVPRLQAALASDAAAAENTPARVEELRAQYHREVASLWNAAGAKLPRRHCRDAWTRFIQQVEPTLRTLFPVAKGGRAQWDTAEMRRSIGALVRTHEEIADSAEARFEDRTKMDKAARRIADLAMGVNAAAEALQHQVHHNGKEALPVDVVRGLLAVRPLEAPDEELCRQAILGLVTGKPAARPLGVSLAMLLRHPDLLSALHGIAFDGAAATEATVAGLDAVADPVRAAAVLLSQPESAAAEGAPPGRQLLRLLAAPHRRWLLARLGANAGPLVPKTARLDDEVAIFEEIDALQVTWSALDELALRARDQVRSVLQEVRDLAAQPGRDFDPTLCRAWLGRVRQFAEECKVALLDHLRARAAAGHKAAAEQALREGRLGDAMHLLQEGSREPASDLAVRETAWRQDARARFPHPLEAIAREGGELCDLWRRGITGNVVTSDRQLRTKFVEELIQGAETRWNQSKEHLVPTVELRQLLKPYNPTFLPQLGRFPNLCILVAPTNPKQGNFEHATAGVIDKLGRENLYAVLAPQISEAGRQATLKELRRRELAAAVIDDLDLCRLLNIGGRRPSGLVALLEIVLEQQAWSTHFTPFAMHDGQHVQIEMYVGRSVEAGQLTQTPAYSRLFSGRKLGKSALLRYVHDTRDGLKLPSGNTLRVLFVPAVGAETDLDIVDRFAEQLAEKLGFRIPGLELDGNAGDVLVKIAKRFVETRPTESLLVVFDEADKFVEAQLEAYDVARESCLSFRMRTQVESFRDAAKSPRIRFVFAGYRATSTSEGAWANWGDVLRLKPLTLDEGARLIAGPLARMGIDATRQATTIAHRCGCQPVVLLRFGELLLKHLEGKHGPNQRDHVVVSAADVAAVFNEEPVREEIRVVVRNNFQDSPKARVVFSALLGEFAQHAPGDGIAEADRLVTERLRAIDADLGWLHPSPEAQVLEVQRLLKDFAARELVLLRRGPDGQPAWHLRFPHHLSILLPEDPEGAIRADIAALRRRGGPVAAEAPRALVSPRELDLLRDATCRPPDPHLRIHAAVVGSHWPEAAASRSCGFPDRLGIPPDACYPPAKADRGLERDRLAVIGAMPEVVQRIAAKRASDRTAPLFLGGVDLLRWALTRQVDSDQMFEIAGLERVSGPTLDWWFGKVRALSFEQLDWRERILRATSGVPLLLAEVERELIGTSDGGIEIGRGRLELALQATASAEGRLAKSLAGADATIALSKREVEILRMLAHVGDKTGYRAPAPREDLTELWDELYRPSLDLPSIDPTSRADRVAAAVLVALGLAPAGGAAKDEDPLRRLITPGAGDALYRIAKALQP